MHLHSLTRNEHVRVKVLLPDAQSPRLPTVDRRLAGGELVRARGLRPLRLPVHGASEPAPPPLPRRLRRARAAQGLRSRAALVLRGGRPPLARLGEGYGRPRRPLRDADDLDRAVAPGDARNRAPDRAPRRRADRARRDTDRLHAPLLREDGRDPHLEPGDPVHGPAELRLRDDQRRRLRADGREDARHRGPEARRADPHDPVRVLPDHGPLRQHRREPRRHGRADQLLVPLPEPREHLRPPRGLLRRAADRLLRAGRRPRDRRARGLRRALPGAPRVDPEVHRRRREARHEQSDPPQPLSGHGNRDEGAGDRVGPDGPDAAGLRRRLRRAPGAALRLLRPVRLGRRDRDRTATTSRATSSGSRRCGSR